MYELIRRSWLLKVFIIYMTTRWWKNTSVIHILVSLKLIQCLKDQLSMLCTYLCQSFKKVAIKISFTEELRKLSHILTWVRILQTFLLSIFWLLYVHLYEAHWLSSIGIKCFVCAVVHIVTYVDTCSSESLSANMVLTSSLLWIAFYTDKIKGVNEQIWLDVIIKRWVCV